MSGGSVHPGVFKMMEKTSTLTGGRSIGYGFGLFLQDFDGLPSVNHSGATAGYRAWLERIPSKGFSIAVLCNAGSANPPAYGHQIARLYLGLPTPDARVSAPANVKVGLYRSMRDNTAVKVEEKDGDLTFDGNPVHTHVRFDGEKMYVPDPTYGDDIYERVKPSTPADLSEFAGTYVSDEAETVFHLTAESGKLTLHRRPDAVYELKPTYADAFQCSLGSVRFLRGAEGKVIGMSIGEPRVWDLRFTRDNSRTGVTGR